MTALPYIITGAVVAYLAVQFLPLLRAKRMQGAQAPDLDAVIEPRQRGQRRLLLYFWSPGCGMCRGMTPVIQALAQSRDDVVAVEVNRHPELVRALRVMGTPTLVLVEDGKVDKVLIGAKSEAQIRTLLD